MKGSVTDNTDKYCVILVMAIYSELAVSPNRAGLDDEQLSKLCPFHSLTVFTDFACHHFHLHHHQYSSSWEVWISAICLTPQLLMVFQSNNSEKNVMQMWCMCIRPLSLYNCVQRNLNIYLSSAGHFEDCDLGLWMELNGWIELRKHYVLKIGIKLWVWDVCTG